MAIAIKHASIMGAARIQNEVSAPPAPARMPPIFPTTNIVISHRYHVMWKNPHTMMLPSASVAARANSDDGRVGVREKPPRWHSTSSLWTREPASIASGMAICSSIVPLSITPTHCHASCTDRALQAWLRLPRPAWQYPRSPKGGRRRQRPSPG